MTKRDPISRLEFLQESHRQLDKAIEKGYTNYIDDADLKKMKQQKLLLKEEIERLKEEQS